MGRGRGGRLRRQHIKRTDSVIPDKNRAISLILGREEKDKDFIFISRGEMGVQRG